MTQHGTPQAKYATGGKRIGLSGSVFLTVAFLVVCVVVFAWIFFKPVTPVRAAPSNLLPALNSPGTITDGMTDLAIQKTEIAIRKEINDVRTLHGLSPITLSSVLSENAYYIAAAMLELGEADLATIHARGQRVAGQLSYIQTTASVYVEDYHCTDPTLGATYFCKTILHHTNYSNAILKKELKEIGVAILQVPINGKNITCAVVCSAVETVSQDQSLVPNPIFKEDITGPVVTSEKIYLSQGEKLTDQMVQAAITVVDERGEVPTLTYDLAVVDSSIEGEQSLLVTVSDVAGNQTECTVPIVIAIPTKPVILSEALYVPEIPEGEYWYLAPYVQVSDQFGIRDVRTEPAFITAEALKEDQTVCVTATNVYGRTARTEIPIVCSETAYQEVERDLDTGLLVEIPEGIELREDGHAILSCTPVEEGIYYFTVTNKDGLSRTFVRRTNSMVWNPETSGDVQVALTVYDGKTGSVYNMSTLNIIVADKQIFVYNTIVVSFKPQSGFVIDHDLQWMHKIEPGTSVLTVKEAMTLAGGTGEVTVSFTNPVGSALQDEDSVTSGTTVSILEDGSVKQSYTIFIYGDINGDGQIGIADFAKLRQELLHGDLITDIYRYAADVNYDGQVGIADFAKLRQYLLGNIGIEQK